PRGQLGRPDARRGDRGARAGRRRTFRGREGEPTMTTVVLLGVLVGLAVGAGAVWLLYRLRRRQLVALKSGAEGTASRILEEASKEGDAIRREAQIQAKDLLIKTKAESEEDAREQRRELVALEKRVAQKEESIAQRIETFTQREADLGARDEAMRQKER